MIRFSCPQCGSTFNVGDWMAGKIVLCPKCRTKVPLPSAAATGWQREDVVPEAVIQDRGESDPARAATPPVKGPDEKYCQECGAVIRAKAVICPECGVRQAGASHGGWGQAAVWCGVCSLFFCFPLGILAIVLGCIGLSADPNKKDARSGVILGTVSVVIWGLVFLLFVVANLSR